MAGSAVIYRLLGESISSLSLLRLGIWRSWLLRVMLLRQSLLRKIRLRAMLIARYYYFAGSALRGTPYGEGALGRVRLRGKLLKEKTPVALLPINVSYLTNLSLASACLKLSLAFIYFYHWGKVAIILGKLSIRIGKGKKTITIYNLKHAHTRLLVILTQLHVRQHRA